MEKVIDHIIEQLESLQISSGDFVDFSIHFSLVLHGDTQISIFYEK